MNQPALYSRRLNQLAQFFVVYLQSKQLVAYIGGQMANGKWRSEFFLVDLDAHPARVWCTEMGDWATGRSFVLDLETKKIRPADHPLPDLLNSDMEDRIYDRVEQWVYWDSGQLHLRWDAVAAAFEGDEATQGEVDLTVVATLRHIWEHSAQRL